VDEPYSLWQSELASEANKQGEFTKLNYRLYLQIYLDSKPSIFYTCLVVRCDLKLLEMNRSQADKVKSETFYYVVQKSNSDTETEPQQTDEVDAALDYKVFEKIYMVSMFFLQILFPK
jgi:hypothetical protein